MMNIVYSYKHGYEELCIIYVTKIRSRALKLLKVAQGIYADKETFVSIFESKNELDEEQLAKYLQRIQNIS